MDECSQHQECSRKLIQNCLDMAATKERLEALEYEYRQINPFHERSMDERCKLIDSQFALVQQRFTAADEALKHAEKVTDAKFHNVNNLREMVENNNTLYLREDIYREKTKYYDAWIEGVNRDITVMKTRSVIYTSILGVIFLIVDMILHFMGK